MKPNKSIIILESAMETVNQALQEAAHDGDLNELKRLSHTLVEMANAVGGLCNAENMADSMEKLHELAQRWPEKKPVFADLASVKPVSKPDVPNINFAMTREEVERVLENGQP